MPEFLACTDGSEYAEKAVKACAKSAKYSGYRITLLHVLEDVVSYAVIPEEPGYQIRKEKANEILQHAKKIVEDIDPNVVCNAKIALGPVASEIVRIAVEGRYEAIFIGCKGTRGIKRMLLGSVTDDVLKYAHCPVTVVR